jgi:uncharacterized protein
MAVHMRIAPIVLPLLCHLAHASTEPVISNSAENQRRLAELLTPVSCLTDYVDTAVAVHGEKVRIPSGGIELAGTLYVPPGPGVHPAVVFMHGGGNDYRLIMAGPRYYAPRLAACGFVALIYDKRGTGESGGSFRDATFDDFISDAGNAALLLSRDDRVDKQRIAVCGGSEGGRLAPNVAVRFPCVSAAISLSGPIGSVADQATVNMEHTLRTRGYSDSLVERVMPLWRRHHAAWAHLDTLEFGALAREVVRLRDSLDPFLIPSTYEELLTDSNLYFLRPGFNSMSRDYTGELMGLHTPYLAILGELDSLINVRETVANIQKQVQAAGNEDCDLFVIKDADHSLVDRNTGRQLPVERILINWLRDKWRLR